jgi:hypothetical protein
MLTQGMKHKALSGSRRSSSLSTDDHTGCGTAVGRLIKMLLLLLLLLLIIT